MHFGRMRTVRCSGRVQTGVKTLPCRNYGVDGNNANNYYSCLYIPDEVSFL